MNQSISTRSTGTSHQAVMIAIRPLFTALPLPRGLDAETLTDGYLLALGGFPVEAIKAVVIKLIRGEMAEQPKFCPRPPELAIMVRDQVRRQREAEQPRPDFRPVSFPLSDRIQRMRRDNGHRQVLAEKTSVDEFRAGFRDGRFPAGSSYIAALGTVYGPEAA